MGTVTLHLLDSLHTWLCVIAFMSMVAAGCCSAWWAYAKDSDDCSLQVKLVAAAAAVMFVCWSLAVFLPTSRSLRDARYEVTSGLEHAKKAAKLKYCIANPGKCK